MNRPGSAIHLFVLLASLAGCALAQCGPWTSNDVWNVDVTTYGVTWSGGFSDPSVEAAKDVPWVDSNHRVIVTVSGSSTNTGTDCWVLRFESPSASNAIVRDSTFLLDVAKDDGSMCGLRQTSGRTFSSSIGIISGHPFLEGPHAFPMEQIPCVAPVVRTNRLWMERSLVRPVWRVERTDHLQDGKRILSMALIEGNITNAIIRQVWTPGEKWWDSFTRHVQGHIDLEAYRVP